MLPVELISFALAPRAQHSLRFQPRRLLRRKSFSLPLLPTLDFARLRRHDALLGSTAHSRDCFTAVRVARGFDVALMLDLRLICAHFIASHVLMAFNRVIIIRYANLGQVDQDDIFAFAQLPSRRDILPDR